MRSIALLGALLASLLQPSALRAQEPALVYGSVADRAGRPLAGVRLALEELGLRGETDGDGQYAIAVPGARVRGQRITLAARLDGYTTTRQRLALTGGPVEWHLELREDVNRRSRPVSAGVSARTDAGRVPFAVSQVLAADMPVAGANLPIQLLGKVSGAQLMATSGRPGSAPSVLLRGPRSIDVNGRSHEPLVLLDGAVLEGPLPDLNPQDIETVEVLRGAAAAALYGSRGGNGVLSITTRTRLPGGDGLRVRSRVEVGAQSVERAFPLAIAHTMLMNETMDRVCLVVPGEPACSRTLDMQAEVRRLNDTPGAIPLAPPPIQHDGGLGRPPAPRELRSLYQVNRHPLSGSPVRQLLTNGLTWNGTAEASGRVGGTRVYVAVNRLRQEGAVRLAEGYERQAARLNVDQRITSRLDLQLRTAWSDASDWNTAGDWLGLTRQPASADLLARDAFGRLDLRTTAQQVGARFGNPLATFERFRPRHHITRVVGSATLTWRALPWLDAAATVGHDARRARQVLPVARGARTLAPSEPFAFGTVNASAERTASRNAALQASAQRHWLDRALDTRVTVHAFQEAQTVRRPGPDGAPFAVPGLRTAPAIAPGVPTGEGTVRQVGVAGAFDATYRDRYLVSALMRRDASSLAGPADRWQTYGRLAAAWRVADEPWFNLPLLSDLTLRGALGTAGNRPAPGARHETFTIAAGGALRPFALANPSLRPERVTERELGADLEITRRYALSITRARAVTDGQLLPRPVATPAGAATRWINAGAVTTDAWEFGLRMLLLSRPDAHWSLHFLRDANRSTITRLDVAPYTVSAAGQRGSATMFRIAPGERLGTIHGRRFVTDCRALPAEFAAQCGGAGAQFQRNADGFIVWTGGAGLGEGITRNLWMTALPAAQAPWGRAALNWGLPIVQRDADGREALAPIGRALPAYRWSLAQDARYKRLTLHALFDATVGRDVWNVARHAALGDFLPREADQVGATVGTARPIGYYWRAPSPAGGIGGLYDVFAPNNHAVEDASFVKLRELAFGVRIGRVAGAGDWTATLIGRNLLTWSRYRGFDPEVGLAGGAFGAGLLNAVDAFGFPNLRELTLSLRTTF